MSIFHNILAFAYPFLRVKNKLFKKSGQGRLRVLLYHDVRPDDIDVFAKQIKWLSKRWHFITPQQFELYLEDDSLVTKDSLLLTFDDGFYSNKVVVEQVLSPLNIKAIFFVVSKFVDLLDKKEAYTFVAENIHPGERLDEVLPHQFNMNWSDLEYLCRSGQTIGGHTATHARLSEVEGTTKIKDQVVESANVIEERLGITIRHFAYTFGDLASFSPNALAVASKRFGFVYSGLRGLNTTKAGPFAIRRDSVTPRNSVLLVGALLEGGVDFLYRRSVGLLDDWVKADSN